MEKENAYSNLTTKVTEGINIFFILIKVNKIVPEGDTIKKVTIVKYPTIADYESSTQRAKRIFHRLKRTKRYTENTYESFSNERPGNKAKAFINAKGYFEDLFNHMMKAKKSIYICGWAISPELFLIRPVALNGFNFQTRLMDVLRIKAQEAVSIKILLYKEVMGTLLNDSKHSKDTLNSLHPNIKVRRHPRNKITLKMWANHEKIVIIDEKVAYVGGIDLFWGRYDNETFSLVDQSNEKNLFEWPGLDYSNDRRKDKTDLKTYTIDYINRETTPRMPWHDVAVRLEGPVVIDVWRHFMQRWSFRLDHKNLYPIRFSNQIILMQIKIDDYLTGRNLTTDQLIIGDLNCQIVRSAAHWSVGNHTTETSLLNAYCDLIDNAKYYIIIENQFFISNTFTKQESGHNISSKMLNNVAYHIRKRIERAYLENEKFRVIIILPLIPAFAGDIKNTQALKSLIKYTFRTINRHRGLSIVEKLLEIMGDKYINYISFFSLRNHALLNGIPKTELVYIHAKIMIVDDQALLIGSANLNDRSLLGKRDSEVAVILRAGKEKVKSHMNGEEIMACEFIKNLRMNLLSIHLGINKSSSEMNILEDPITDQFWKFFHDRARKNTLLYREIFRCVPDDIYETFEDIKSRYDYNCKDCLAIMQQKYFHNKDLITGFIVEFPINFLKKENLSRGIFTKEKVISINLFM